MGPGPTLPICSAVRVKRVAGSRHSTSRARNGSLNESKAPAPSPFSPNHFPSNLGFRFSNMAESASMWSSV